jgi:hypothetical protein
LTQADCAAWTELFDATQGPGWNDCTSRRTDPCGCDESVICTGYYITAINLGGNNLRGTLPASLGKLVALDRLHLANNALSGFVPDLPFAQYTQCAISDHADSNDFACPVPPQAQLCKDGVPRCNHAACTGSSASLSPQECIAFVTLYDATGGAGWQQCSGLRLDPCACAGSDLYVRCSPANATSVGVNDSQLQLTKLHLHRNNLDGTLPAAIGQLSHLTELHLSNNKLSGTLPREIGRLTSLSLLFLKDNSLSGWLPPELGSAAGLAQLKLGSNAFSGAIPGELGQLRQLVFLALEHNRLTGSIPALPFAQYTQWCSLTDVASGCNRFLCPLPPAARDCHNNGAGNNAPPQCEAAPTSVCNASFQCTFCPVTGADDPVCRGRCCHELGGVCNMQCSAAGPPPPHPQDDNHEFGIAVGVGVVAVVLVAVAAYALWSRCSARGGGAGGKGKARYALAGDDDDDDGLDDADEDLRYGQYLDPDPGQRQTLLDTVRSAAAVVLRSDTGQHTTLSPRQQQQRAESGLIF